MKTVKKTLIVLVLTLLSINIYAQRGSQIVTGAEQTNLYLPYLKGKNIGMVVNQTSVMGKNQTFSVDSLVKLGVNVKKIFGPSMAFAVIPLMVAR
jgi:uncharacterized protein YbbC (DUF1343 family)